MKAHGLAHATLTVSDVQKTKAFYERLFGMSLSMDDERSFSLLTVGVPCWFVQWEKQYPADRFDERKIGLDHIAFKLETLEELKHFVNVLDEVGVRNAGLERFAGKYPYVAFRDPDNIQVEFFIPKELMMTRDQAKRYYFRALRNSCYYVSKHSNRKYVTC